MNTFSPKDDPHYIESIILLDRDILLSETAIDFIAPLRRAPGLDRFVNFIGRFFIGALAILCLSIMIGGSRASASPQGEPLPYSAFKGRRISSISVDLRQIFDDPGDNFIYNQANNLKLSTKDFVILREVLFKEGEEFDPFLLQESERNLRGLRYLRNVTIEVVPTGDTLDIIVHAQDTWTLIPQFAYSSGTGRTRMAGGLADSNFMGYGKRAEILYEKDESLNSIEGVWDDSRVMGTLNRLIVGAFHRSDGDRGVLYFGRPYRSLVEDTSWSVESDLADVVGRLFQNGEERYIFREKLTDVTLRYTFSGGDPEVLRHRFSLGYNYSESDFYQADAQDYKDVDVDPDSVSMDPALLAADRRFSGPVFSYQAIEPDFVAMSYFDRFDRVEDYNLGNQIGVSSQIAPTFLGSLDDTYLFSASESDGLQFNAESFLRGEAAVTSRIDSEGFANTIFRAESKYYGVLGTFEPLGFYLGRHTFASSLLIDYGIDMDKDREFLVGSDNGVRGYDARTFTGDKRLILNLEDRVHLYDDLFQLVSLGTAMFIDVGTATNDSFGDMVTNDMYAAVGVGLRLGFPRSSGGRVFRIDLAVPLRDGPDGSKEFEPRIILSGGQLFSARLKTESFGPDKANVAVGIER